MINQASGYFVVLICLYLFFGQIFFHFPLLDTNGYVIHNNSTQQLLAARHICRDLWNKTVHFFL